MPEDDSVEDARDEKGLGDDQQTRRAGEQDRKTQITPDGRLEARQKRRQTLAIGGDGDLSQTVTTMLGLWARPVLFVEFILELEPHNVDDANRQGGGDP